MTPLTPIPFSFLVCPRASKVADVCRYQFSNSIRHEYDVKQFSTNRAAFSGCCTIIFNHFLLSFSPASFLGHPVVSEGYNNILSITREVKMNKLKLFSFWKRPSPTESQLISGLRSARTCDSLCLNLSSLTSRANRRNYVFPYLLIQRK